MPPWLQALFLGAIQGLTEFLPISSDGHLALFQQWLGESFAFKSQPIAFDLVLHLGTLLPVLYFYRRELASILKATFSEMPKGGVSAWLKSDEHRWLAWMVVLGTIPTGLMGIGLKDVVEELFHSTTATCIGLFLTGCILYTTKLFAKDSSKEITIAFAILIGIAQGIAIAPGVSRSGCTITTALLLGIPREKAARYSFMLSIPAIVGASILMLKDGLEVPPGAGLALVVGFFTAMVVGYGALVMLVALVKRGGIHKFSYYLWPAAVVFYLL
jgi:undecaprenyl-diphosphatase